MSKAPILLWSKVVGSPTQTCSYCHPDKCEQWEKFLEYEIDSDDKRGRCGMCCGPIAEGVQGVMLTPFQKIIPIVSYGGVIFSRNSDGHPGAPLTSDGLIDWDKIKTAEMDQHNEKELE